MKNQKIHIKQIFIFLFLVSLAIFYFALAKELFITSTATVLYDNNNQLLGASIAADQQWRFPPIDSVPHKFASAIIQFEDQHFYSHPGINPASILRAIQQNWKAKKIVSGASTLSMQVIRLSRKGKPRSIKEKLIEIILALRLELRYSKTEILNLYASHAPFGGNTVGLETAAWRYYGTSPEQLSWGEAATLAVLPNQPSLIYPGKHDSLLINKRNRLLNKLYTHEKIDQITYELATQEQIPAPPGPLPQLAPHYLEALKNRFGTGKRLASTLDQTIQRQVNQIVARQHQRLTLDQINNAAVLVAEIKTGKILSYVGNTPTTSEHQNQVDIVQARRSPGSTLKPFLYAAALDDGLIMPKSLLPDVPTYYQGFTPKNFALDYDGAVPADEALARSLNIPFVQLLDQYSYPKFNDLLKEVGFTSLDQNPDHYGLSIILGGAEVTLFELANSYLKLAQLGLGHREIHPLYLNKNKGKNSETFPISTAACWHTLVALLEVNRPGEENSWRQYNSSQQIAWKTGTSFGFKDAWAIGISAEHLVAVWVGNADGEGRPSIIGSKAAAPILFDVFNHLKSKQPFRMPTHQFEQIAVCAKSGLKATPACTESTLEVILPRNNNHALCPYHQEIFINSQGDRVLVQCASNQDVRPKYWFVLPPIMAKYYQQKHSDYQSIPRWSPSCFAYAQSNNLQWIYPGKQSDLFIPLELDGKPGKVIFELAHHLPQQKVFWHLDNQYLGHTKHDHKLAAWIPEGKHHLVVVDELGESLEKRFSVLGE